MRSKSKSVGKPALQAEEKAEWQRLLESPEMQAALEAVREMRKRLRWTRPVLANEVAIGERSLARYENKEGPLSLAAAVKLENLAHAAKYADLGETFGELIQKFVRDAPLGGMVAVQGEATPNSPAAIAFYKFYELWRFYPPKNEADERLMRTRMEELLREAANAFPPASAFTKEHK